MPLAEMMTHGSGLAVQGDALVDLVDVADAPLAEEVRVALAAAAASRSSKHSGCARKTSVARTAIGLST